MARTTYRVRGPQFYVDRLHAIEDEANCGGATATANPSALDPCMTQLVQLAEALLDEREWLLAHGETLADSVFRPAADEYRAQIREQAAVYSTAYHEIDRTLAGWRSWMHGLVTAS